MPPHHDPPKQPQRSWRRKFGCAFRGLACGVRGQRSFYVHFTLAAAVVACAVFFQAALWQWCVLLLCIAIVLTAEMFNSALELFGKMITDKYDPRMADALDIGSAAVLVASIGAAIVGAIVFIDLLLQWLQ